MAYQNIWEKRGIYRRYEGVVTGSDLLSAIHEIEGDIRFDQIRYVINDFLAVSEQAITQEELEEVAALDYATSLSNANIRLAIVTADPLLLEIADRYRALSDSPYPTRTFAQLRAARVWCDGELPE
jgi:hypothetical protein